MSANAITLTWHAIPLLTKSFRSTPGGTRTPNLLIRSQCDRRVT